MVDKSTYRPERVNLYSEVKGILLIFLDGRRPNDSSICRAENHVPEIINIHIFVLLVLIVSSLCEGCVAHSTADVCVLGVDLQMTHMITINI